MAKRALVVFWIVIVVSVVLGVGRAVADVSFYLTDTLATSDIPESMCTCNLDADPMLEFVVVLGWSGEVVAYDHDGTELWSQTTGWYGAVGAGNVDGDPQDEVAVNSADHHLYVYDNDGTVLCVFGLSELGHDRPRFGDLDGDGDNEIVCSEWDSNVYSATPANVYAFDPQDSTLLWTYQLPDDGVTHVGDFDGDDAAEVVASSRSDATTPLLVFLDGDGSVIWDTTAHAWRVGFWDVDDDDTLDVVFEWSPQGGVWCYGHNGEELFSCTDKGTFTRLEDLDGDGETEFLTIDGDTLRCIREDCTEAWSHTFPSAYETYPVVMDADGIGEKEVVTALTSGDTVYVLSHGEIVWQDTLSGANGRCSFPEYYGDMSGNGMDDIILGNAAQWIYLYYNTTQSFRILSIRDIPNDQGRQVRVTWSRCLYDDAEADSLVVTEYSLWRKVDPDLVKAPPMEGNLPLDTPPGDWDFIATIPAVQDSTYNYVAPTLADSNLNDGMYYSVFFVRAHTSNPLVHWETEPDSGYSVDNLAPAVPKGLTADISDSTVLTWLSNSEPDLAYYAIYRGSCPDFTPGTPLAYTTDTTYIDMETGYCYMVSAFDFAGNESPLTGSVSVGEDGAQPELPDDFSLSQNYPNPFNPTTLINYALPKDAKVRLEIFNLLGQKVATLVDKRQQAGYRSVRWDASSFTSGIYFYRLQAGDFVETKRMILLK